jgi:hypothetical protein
LQISLLQNTKHATEIQQATATEKEEAVKRTISLLPDDGGFASSCIWKIRFGGL